MKSLLSAIVIIFTVNLTACAGRIVHLEDANGTQLTCEVSTGSAMMTGILIRDNSIEKCVKQHESKGFKVTSEE